MLFVLLVEAWETANYTDHTTLYTAGETVVM